MFPAHHRSAPPFTGFELSRTDEIKEALDFGPGFALVRGFPLDDRSLPETVDELEAIAAQLGPVTRHGATGQTVWPITPRREVGALPTFSETSAEAPLHTDNSWVARPERYLAMLTLVPANRGGESIVLGLEEALGEMAETPKGKRAIDCLSRQKFPFASPTIFEEGKNSSSIDGSCVLASVLGPGPTIRYRHDLILEGLARHPDLATSEGIESLDYLHRYLTNALNRSVRLPLERGDLLFVSNTRALHARTEFCDPERFLLRVRMG